MASIPAMTTAACLIFFLVTRSRSPSGDEDADLKPCKKTYIVIAQAAESPLPNGIPTFSVEICRTCMSGCPILDVHVSCGLLATAKLVNPRLFRRVGPDNGIVSDGQGLESGNCLSFVYANSLSYPKAVSRANFC